MACDLGKNTIAPNEPRFRVLSLNDNMPLLSALANDVGYEHVFSEQLTNLIRPGDVLISISGSGNSPNILHAMAYARHAPRRTSRSSASTADRPSNLQTNSYSCPSTTMGSRRTST